MAVIKCKMCGGDLVLVEGQSVAECEYCGSRQTVPVADNEKKLTLFARANRLRAACEFDKAAGIYESIVADFPEEAEAYWGLVLCKYGIEYVDDPATGKKIPTCHRSSFDSVMDDGNFDQAMENADAVALKVYREEAKQIETIRKGILEVSSSEKPYDIFICYKETDANGDRTVDSLLAQDIYDALTAKGYRVFFSRITLEDKLGQAYEPYIFAALNSAKIMLAVGTCYEHYNAVWVKNEWSRYLKIIAQDKNKYLIPCYKGIDAYDIPKEFAHLQGQDMGKVGAIQDLLRGIEKIIPKKDNTIVIQEKVVVGGTGGSNKIASLLDRGNMALEDGDWAKADSFFEDVLNNDSKNAQAYLGKTLAQEKCRTMDALKRKRLENYPTPKSETLYIPERTAHVGEIIGRCCLPGYVEESAIRKLYEFDRSYESLVSGRQKQYREEEIWWQNHKQLSRAEKFAAGTVAENLRSEKQHLFSQLADRVKKAQEADARSVARLEAAYDAHIAEADAKAEQMYNDGLANREKDYQTWLGLAKTTEKIDQLKDARAFFEAQGLYKDSKNLAEHCRKRIADITAEQERKDAERRAAEAVEAEKRRIAEEKAAAERKKRNTVIGVISGIVAVVAVVVFFVMTKVVIPGNNYKAAEELLAAGQYEEAIAAFTELGEYKDSADRILECEEAILADAYAEAEALLNEGDTAHAAMAFGKLGDYRDARQRSFALWDGIAVRDTIGVGNNGTFAVKNDGTVIANEYAQVTMYLPALTDIIAISVAGDHIVGLRADGTVVIEGTNSFDERDVSDWTDIVAITTNSSRTIGLKSDGTVVTSDDADYCKEWSDIVAVSDFGRYGLASDGSVVAPAGEEPPTADKWAAIADESYDYTVGLNVDGTVDVIDEDSNETFDVSSWRNIMDIEGSRYHIVGLRADGSVFATGVDTNGIGMLDVDDWTDIVAISTNDRNTVGLKSDGTVVAVGYNEDGQCDVAELTDIKLPVSGYFRQTLNENMDIRSAQDYDAAVAMLEAGDYENAIAGFKALGDYRDSQEKWRGVVYQRALAFMEQQDYENAYKNLAEVHDYKDAAEYLDDFYLLPSEITIYSSYSDSNNHFYFSYDKNRKMTDCSYYINQNAIGREYTFNSKGQLTKFDKSPSRGYDWDDYVYTYKQDGTITATYSNDQEWRYDRNGNLTAFYYYGKLRYDYSQRRFDDQNNCVLCPVYSSTKYIYTYDDNGTLWSVTRENQSNGDVWCSTFFYTYLYLPEKGIDEATMERNWTNIRLIAGNDIWGGY